jgi:hypothetical protein
MPMASGGLGGRDLADVGLQALEPVKGEVGRRVTAIGSRMNRVLQELFDQQAPLGGIAEGAHESVKALNGIKRGIHKAGLVETKTFRLKSSIGNPKDGASEAFSTMLGVPLGTSRSGPNLRPENARPHPCPG